MEVQDISGKTTEYPCFTCGHCTSVVMVNLARTRPHDTCGKCGRWTCNQELCRLDCTPTYDLAADHVVVAGKWSKYLPAIMGGATTLEEASLLIPDFKE